MTYKEPLCFIAGAAIGAVTAVFVVKRKYERYANEQIEECRHGYNHKLFDLSQQNRNKPPVSTLAEKIDETKTESVNNEVENEDYSAEGDPEEPVIAVTGPEVRGITDDEYAYDRGYDKETVIIYADGTLARDVDDDILDVIETIGPNAYELAMHDPDPDEPVYVRNETNQTDYEILLSAKTYTEATGIYVRGI